jgi:hypothetical protein
MSKFVQTLRRASIAKAAASTGLALFAASSFAAADATVVDQTKADMLVYLGAMLLLAVAVWGLRKTISLFGR